MSDMQDFTKQCNLPQSKKSGKDQKPIHSSTTPDPGYHMDVTQKQFNITHKSKEANPFPADDHKASMNRRESMTNTNINNRNDPQKKYRLGTVSKNILLEGLNKFHGANLSAP